MELNADQLRIVNNKPNGHVLIKGVAGSGKTTVAVSKLPMLINHYMAQKDKILFVTYNKTLIQYTEYLIKDMNIQQNIFFEFNRKTQLEIKTIDAIVYKYCQMLKLNRILPKPAESRNIMLRAISEVKKNYPNTELISEKNYAFLNEEIEWLKACEYIERETYLNIDRVGRMSRGENKYRLQKNSAERNAIFDIYLWYEEFMRKQGFIDFKTSALKVLEAFREGWLKPENYRHIIVDESQDLSRVQLEIIKYLYPSDREDASIIFIADVSQSIYTQSWLSGQSFKSIGFDMSGKSNILSKNYRTTFEIAKAAYSLIENDENIKENDIFVKPVAIERYGEKPYYKHYNNLEQETNAISKRIKHLITKGYSLKDIVITAANKVCLENIKMALIKNGIDAALFDKAEPDFDEDKIRLFTLHSVKGLEFPVLFIPCINEGVLPLKDDEISVGRRLLYVGMTRAKQELYLSSSDKESVFISELDKTLLSSDQTEIVSLYKVDISEYLFTDKVKDIYSREEMVRQWFIRELIDKKQYTESEIEIEYPVQAFSSTGYADIVVHRVIDNKRVPYIMAEIKQPGEDMNRAMKQLVSYVRCCPTIEFIVATDGSDTVIRNVKDNYNIVETLPVYNGHITNLYKKFTYLMLGNRKEYAYEINCEDTEEIIVRDKASNAVMDLNDYINVNVIGQVAAGVLRYANQEYLGRCKLPALFVSGKDEFFMLEVNGDSMINFDINDKDFVIVKSQNYAKNEDIVVAGKRGSNEVTLKKYHNFNGTVGLMAGNPNYESIMIPEHEIFVNGVVVGVLKRE